MAKNTVVTKRLSREEELIRKIAKYILSAFCLQFVVYLFLLNIIPIGTDQNGDNMISYNELNSMYYEKWDGLGQYSVNGERVYIDNGMQFIYGYNMMLLVATLLLAGYYMLVFTDKNEGRAARKIKEFFKENKALLVLLGFMVWTFFSCILAKDLFRSFCGCFNLRDGYFSFMFYGSVLICMLLLGKDNKKDQKFIMNLFLISATVVAVLTLANYYFNLAGKSFFIETKHIGSEIISGIFNNSNHYGYFLSIAVVVAATMAVNEKKFYLKALYGASFLAMTWMLILNNTFGAYLGVGVVLILMVVHAIIVNLSKMLKSNGNRGNISLLIATAICLAVFIAGSFVIKNANGEIIAKKNFEGIFSDVKTILSSSKDSTNTRSDNSENTISGEASGENSNTTSTTNANDAGSGRWELWVGGIKLIKTKPILGYGLENMKAEYYNQLGIGEGRSHNLLIQLAGTTGIPGMLLYIVGIMMILFRNLRYYKEWDMFSYTGVFVIISYIISSIVGNSGFYTSGYFYIFVGLIALTPAMKKQSIK